MLELQYWVIGAMDSMFRTSRQIALIIALAAGAGCDHVALTDHREDDAQLRGPMLKTNSLRTINQSLSDMLNTTSDQHRKQLILLGMEQVIGTVAVDDPFLDRLRAQKGLEQNVPILNSTALAQLIYQDGRIRKALMNRNAEDFVRVANGTQPAIPPAK